MEYLSPKTLQEIYPQFQYKRHTNMVGVLEPGGGFLRPEQIMKEALREAFAEGNHVTVMDETKITKRVDSSNNGERIELHLQRKDETEGIVVTTDKLLVSIGARTAELIPTWNRILQPVRQIQAWIDTGRHSAIPDLYSCRSMPPFVYVSPDWPEALYGVPCDEEANSAGDDCSTNRARWLKVGIHKQATESSFSFSNHLPYATTAELEELKRAVPHCIDEVAWTTDGASPPPFAETKPCLYTMSPDKHFVIGEPTNNTFCVAGLSGHGFKMTPALGQMMADYALGKDAVAEWNTNFCSPLRFSFIS